MIDRMMPYFPAALAVLVIISFYAFAIAPYDLETTESNFTLFGGAGEPVKVVLIADVEGAYDYPQYLATVVERTNAVQPDVIFVAGDIVNSEELGWERLGPLGRLKARYGVYAVLGNQDYQHLGCPPANDSYADSVAAKLESMGVTVLRNDFRVLEVHGHRFAIVGLDDFLACRSDFGKSELGVPAGVPQVLLSHNPLSAYNESLRPGTLVLSGHTHCGQVRLPVVSDAMMHFLWLDTLGGRTKIGDADAYITCGIVPGGVRFLTRPEISVLYLE